MASYIQSWLQSSSMPKRLLQYALSRLDIIETDSLDLGNLDIAWGKNSTFEFRDVDLRLRKLETLLQLPPSFNLVKARILLLRLTVPVNIYSSPVQVEVEGVECRMRMSGQAGQDAGRDGNQNRTAHRRNESVSCSPLPTTVNLAKSFLQSQSDREKEELEAAIISETHNRQTSSTLSVDDDDHATAGFEVGEGTGESLSLPAFMATFLQGIMDRLQVKICGIVASMDLDLPQESSRLSPMNNSDHVTLQLCVDDVKIEGVTHETAFDSSPPDCGHSGQKGGKRKIVLGNLQGCLISDATVFANLVRSSTSSSSEVPHYSIVEDRRYTAKPTSATAGSGLETSDRADSPEYPSPASSRGLSAGLSPMIPHIDRSGASVGTSDHARFEDASDDDVNTEALVLVAPSSDKVDLSDAVLESMRHSKLVTDGQYLEDEPNGNSATFVKGLPQPSSRSTPTHRSAIGGGRNEVPSSGQLVNQAHSTTLGRRNRISQTPINSRPAYPHDLSGSDLDSEDMYDDTISVTQSKDGSGGVLSTGDDNLARSQLFSHEYAESMYMSAVSHEKGSGSIPGAWELASDESDESTAPGPSRSAQAHQSSISLDNLEHARQRLPATRSSRGHNQHQSIDSVSVNQEPIAGTDQQVKSTSSTPVVSHSTSRLSEKSTISSEGGDRIIKHVINLDQVHIYLTGTNTHLTAAPAKFANGSSSIRDVRLDMARSTPLSIPGAFADHPPITMTRSSDPVTGHPEPTSISSSETIDASVDVKIGSLAMLADFSIGRLIVRILHVLQDAIPSRIDTKVPDVEPRYARLDVRITSELTSIKFLEKLPSAPSNGSLTWKGPADTDVLLQATLKDSSVTIAPSRAVTRITLGKINFGYAKADILSFDARAQLRSSIRDLPASAGFDCSISITRSAGHSRYDVSTLPLVVSLDLQKMDEILSWLGGLSSVLSLGTSLVSSATVTTTYSTRAKKRNVRFASPIKPEDTPVVTHNKADIRLGGLALDVVGSDCSIQLTTSAVKIVRRDEGIGVGIDRINLSGPHQKRSDDDPAIVIDISSMRVEYLPSPMAADLDRLLSLITPSKSKYDQDDDILIDTLLRQRKQGPVLRLSIDAINARVAKLDDLNYLPELLQEASRLSTVARYLPEDDRPGLLFIVEIHTCGSHWDISNEFGAIDLEIKELQIAQITMPALVALGIDTFSVRRNGSEVLLGVATPIALQEHHSRTPAVMARMIGDEMEPVIKIKLWNIQFEHRIPTLLALLELRDNVSAGDISTHIAVSVASLTDLARTAVQPDTREVDKPELPTSKPIIVDVVLRDCVLGLNPAHLPSKALLVFTEAHIAAVLPKEHYANVTAELSKASLLVIDDVGTIKRDDAPTRYQRSLNDRGSQVANLCSMGFVTVSYISSAKAIIRLMRDENDSPSVDVELRDDLFVLETCADSTQTLVAIMSNLFPPTPPNKDTKYRTKVIPVADLLASLSGDAFGTAEGDYDFDEDFGLDQAVSHGTQSEMEGSDESDADSDYYQQGTMDLDDEGGEEKLVSKPRASLSLDMGETSDGILLESIAGRPEVDPNEQLDFKEEYFSTASVLDGTAHRWNSARNTYDKSNAMKVQHSPLKICIRDVHLIWNIFYGYDWQSTRDAISKAVQDVETKSSEKRARNERRSTFDQDIEDEETVIGDFLFNSIYIGITANRDPRELAAAINQELNDNATETESIATASPSSNPSGIAGSRRSMPRKLRLNRSKQHKITFELKGVCVDMIAFPPESGETQSSVDVRVHDFEIFDHVSTSTWRKFATYMQEAGEREIGSSMIHLEILNVKPVPKLAASEMVLKATILPLRLHVDQDALDFITRFFEFKNDSYAAECSTRDIPFLQRVEVNSIQVKLDFKPKRVDYAGLRSGHTTEFMNFVILDEADMVLRHTIIYGVSGFDKLGKTLNDIWMPDIKRNQLPGILAGLAPVRSLVNVGGGFRHLLVVPMHEYNKDGRLVRGISKGAAKFAKTTGTELVKLGAKVAIGVQTVLQGAEGFLAQSSDPSSGVEGEDDNEEKKLISLYANQPVGVFQGIRGGYAGLQRDLVLARDAIIAVPGEMIEEGTAKGVLRAVRKHAPTVILRPAIGVAKASGQILMGATNSMDPVNLRRVDAKYKKH